MTDLDTTPRTAARTWRPPTAIAPRGTLVVLPGRGEHGLVYERFGRRLAADGYVVHALDTTSDAALEDVLTAGAAAVGPDADTPLVLVGSDTGALQALHIATIADPRLPVRGIILTGTVTTATATPATGWEAELDARTACPAHRRKITDDADFARGRLSEPVPHHLLHDVRPDLPVLILHGADDPLAPLDQARALARRLPHATFGVLDEGRHDVLNDASHRTTAAHVVIWLERLRADTALRPILTVEAEPED
ncbi:MULTISPECIES: alpha/beta hydrolase [unclassified Streptomyces]|uniref:alpha/beta hydrolase n=1 Tax=unclassified Streptomyces TaxID=2593676 RepID=UPI0036E39944